MASTVEHRPVSDITVTVGRPSSLAEIVLPLDRYYESPEEELTLARARDKLVSRCLLRFGFEWRQWTARGIGVDRRQLTKNQYLFRSADVVSQHGYHPPPPTEAERRREADVAEQHRVLPAAAVPILRGDGARTYRGKAVPEGGCRAEADRIIERGAPPLRLPGLGDEPGPGAAASARQRAHDAVDQLRLRAGERALRDPAMLQIFSQWRACMADTGHRYETPFHAWSDPRWSGPLPTPDEIAVASADMACKRRLNYLGVASAIETAYQQRAVLDNREPLNSVRANLDGRVRNAQRILGSA